MGSEMCIRDRGTGHHESLRRASAGPNSTAVFLLTTKGNTKTIVGTESGGVIVRDYETDSFLQSYSVSNLPISSISAGVAIGTAFAISTSGSSVFVADLESGITFDLTNEAGAAESLEFSEPPSMLSVSVVGGLLIARTNELTLSLPKKQVKVAL